jgi:hypothetical protein
MLCMLSMVSSVMLYMENLYSMSCRHFLPLYVVSSNNYPRELCLHMMALMLSSLWWCGHLCFGSRLVKINVGVVLLFSRVAFLRGRPLGFVRSCVFDTSICVCVLKSLMSFLPRYMRMIGHLPLL